MANFRRATTKLSAILLYAAENIEDISGGTKPKAYDGKLIPCGEANDSRAIQCNIFQTQFNKSNKLVAWPSLESIAGENAPPKPNVYRKIDCTPPPHRKKQVISKVRVRGAMKAKFSEKFMFWP